MLRELLLLAKECALALGIWLAARIPLPDDLACAIIRGLRDELEQ